jgi:putative ABC transport system permease protein
MNINDFFLVALGALTANKLRSLLTMLGIIIGVAAVIVMTALGEGAQAQIQQQIASLGTNIIIIVPGAVRQGSVSMGGGTGTRLVLDDVTKIERNAGLIEGISPIVRLSVQAVGGAGNWNTQVNGVSVAYFSIRDWLVASGDVFTDADVRSQAKVCILGQTIAKNLFPNDDPVGQHIRLRNVPFKIIGLLSEKGQGASGTDQDDVILAPYTTVQNRMSGFRPIQQILCKAVNENQMNEATEEIRSLVRESHKLQDGDDDDFTIRSQTDIAATAQETTRVLTLLLASVAGVSLLVGGIGIMNIMLVSVTERTREVGIRRAIGATRFVILGQFLVEAMVLSLLGGVLGITVGFLGSLIIENVSAWRMVITPGIVFLSFGFSAGVGIFFGFYPARKASLLNTIDALRYE